MGEYEEVMERRISTTQQTEVGSTTKRRERKPKEYASYAVSK